MPRVKQDTGTATPANKQKGKKICSCCGKEKNLTDFYISKSQLFALDGRVPICKTCISESVIDKNTGELDEVELNKICRKIDKPYYKDLIFSSISQLKKENSYLSDEEIKSHGYEILKFYWKNVAMRQDRNKSYEDSEKDGFIHKNSNRTNAEKNKIISNVTDIVSTNKRMSVENKIKEEVKWSKKDKQNMNYVISTVGYDPFDDLELSEADRKYCFNIMAGYCDTDGIVEDGNKMQGVIEMTNMYCQCKNFTAAINAEMNKDNPDDQKVTRLTNSKTSMLSSISTIAKDNNISSNYNKNSKQGQNSLTSKMKEMEENDFEMIKVNLFDIKTSEAFKQIADLSNQSIMDQLTFDNNDYTEIVKEQRETIQSNDLEIETLKEENRNLKNKIIDLENRKR